MHFAEWVMTRRKALGLSQMEAAEKAGVHQSVWSEYENPQRDTQPRKKTVIKVADALRASHAEALEAAGYNAEKSDIPAELITIWERVPVQKRSDFLRVAKELAGVF